MTSVSSFDRDRVLRDLLRHHEKAFFRENGREPTWAEFRSIHVRVEKNVRELTEKGWLR